ncbi:glycosyltransferase [Hahella aquimaris]|uniref:glycosyltransferase n=1 Tax=Hahella sp. HNIBRBA332 TaxID=3015983 RepID=UPI00273C3DDD|nr:glycosyltransferase [Hahella sp. HNIBRBA332]WLQ17384.1 glycosyltransferase [Hahella sp. HNIBRBA332]
MNELFNNLLVSCPNQGGLFLIHEGVTYKLDNFSATGFSVNSEKFARGLQPSSVLIHSQKKPDSEPSTVAADDIHDVLIVDDFIYFVGTSGNEIIKVDGKSAEIDRWTFEGDVDSLHINCLGLWNERIVFSAFGDFKQHREYKGKTREAGYVKDLLSGKELIKGLSQPHSLTPLDENLLLANSEKKEIAEYNSAGELVRSKVLGGYTRGICVTDDKIFVGLSASRNLEDPGVGSATIVALDKVTWEELGRLSLLAPEVYEIQQVSNKDLLCSALGKVASYSSETLSQVIHDREQEILVLEQKISALDLEALSLKQKIGALDLEALSLKQKIGALDLEALSLKQEIKERDSEISRLSQDVAAKLAEIDSLGQTILDRDEKLAAFSKAAHEHKQTISNLQHIITQIEHRLSVFAEKDKGIGKVVLSRLESRSKLLYWYWKLLRSPLFDSEWYLKNYPDVAQKGVNPLKHYLAIGWKESRQPGPYFDSEYYRARYPDIAGLDMPPLVHYWLHGCSEGRHPNSLFDMDWNRPERDLSLSSNEESGTLAGQTSSTNPILISVIIPTYNRGKLLPEIIAAWREVNAVTLFPYEIIFSDDGSSDGSVEFLETVNGLPLKVLRNAHGGASSARNAAIRAASGDKLLIIGDDIFPDPQILNIHAEICEQLGPKVATLGVVDWHQDLDVNHLMHHITEIGNEQFSYNRLKDNDFTDFRHFYTCNICVDRRFLLEEDVIFDERFDEYGFEDIELGYRLAKRGLKLFYTTRAKGDHYHPYVTSKFCKRQISAGKMAVVFARMHSGIDTILGVASLEKKAHKSRASQFSQERWQQRLDALVSRCEYYEELIAATPDDISMGIRKCLSTLYVHLFRAMYEYGVIQKLGDYPNSLAIAMEAHFPSIGSDYWDKLEKSAGETDGLSSAELYNLCEALNTGSERDLHYGSKQRQLFDELMQAQLLLESQVTLVSKMDRFMQLASRAVYHLLNNPRYLIHRTRQLISENKRSGKLNVANTDVATVIKAIPALVVGSPGLETKTLVANFRRTFGDTAKVYELLQCGMLSLIEESGLSGNPITPSAAEATAFYWPISSSAISCPDHLYSAYVALIENSLDLSIISNSLASEGSICISNLRDHMIFSRDIAHAVFENELNQTPLRGKILRLLPARSSAVEARIGEVLDCSSVEVDEDGFFSSQEKPSHGLIRYESQYLPPRLSTKPVIFVFPIFLAVGGVERNTVEIMRKLNQQFDFIVITMERLRAEQGSLAAQAMDVAAQVIEMAEIVRHEDYLRVLTRLKSTLKPELVWVCNGSPWFCDNAPSIRRVFRDVPIIDQEVYDVEQGWITRYGEPGIRSFDHFIAVNKKIERRFREDFGIDPKQTHLIYSAVDTLRIQQFKQSQPDEAELREKFGLPQGKRIFTFVARLTQQKRPLEFLKLAKLRCGNQDEYFVLVGDGELADEANAFIEKNELKNVKRIPYVENTLELHAVTDGIIFTSAYEGLPIAMIEALAMGVPAFATDVGDIADVVSEYYGGGVISVNLSDININTEFENWLKNHQEYRVKLKAREQDILDRFSSSNIAKQYVECWDGAIRQYKKQGVTV